MDGTLADWATNHARYRSFNWYNWQDIPMMEYTMSLYNAHNNLQGYGPIMWDFMKCYSVVDNGDGTVTRYYSPSGFKVAGDEIVIEKEAPTVDATAYYAAHDEFCSYYDTETWRFKKELFTAYTDASVSFAETIMNAVGGAHAALLAQHGKLEAGRFDESDGQELLDQAAAMLNAGINAMKAVLIRKP